MYVYIYKYIYIHAYMFVCEINFIKYDRQGLFNQVLINFSCWWERYCKWKSKLYKICLMLFSLEFQVLLTIAGHYQDYIFFLMFLPQAEYDTRQIQNFPSLRLVAKPSFKNPFCLHEKCMLDVKSRKLWHYQYFVYFWNLKIMLWQLTYLKMISYSQKFSN